VYQESGLASSESRKANRGGNFSKGKIFISDSQVIHRHLAYNSLLRNRLIKLIKELCVKYHRKSLILILTVVALVGLAACSSATPTPVEPTAAPTSAPEATDAAGVLPTQAVISLEGAETTASNLQFLALTPGEGAAPKEGDLLTLHFTAKLPDGTEFANTRQQGGTPIQLIYLKDQILAGMDEGLGLMKAGGSARMVLPPELAFGAEGYPGMVPANSQVILEVELVRVSQPPKPPEVAEADLTSTASGLKYAELAAGEGEAVTAGDVVRTNYTIWVQGGAGRRVHRQLAGRRAVELCAGGGRGGLPRLG
jgi:peptidylprolyl isomerase